MLTHFNKNDNCEHITLNIHHLVCDRQSVRFNLQKSSS
jgi:hypothetical protein